MRREELVARVLDTVEKCKDAIGDTLVENFPEAIAGDLSPEATITLDESLLAAVVEWVANNVPGSPTVPRELFKR